MEDRIIEVLELVCVRDGNFYFLVGKIVVLKRKVFLDICKLYYFISFNYDLVLYVCIVDEEDRCLVFCDGDYVWIIGFYGFYIEFGNLVEIII